MPNPSRPAPGARPRLLAHGLLFLGLLLLAACTSGSPPVAQIIPTAGPSAAPAAAIPPTGTVGPLPPSATAVPAPPSATPVPPSATPVPPSATPGPPSATPGPPSATPVPPTPGPPRSIAVLAYHHFGVPAAGDYDCPLDKFEEQLEWLKAHGYQSILPQQYVDTMHGKATLPARPVIITFDDDNAEQYTDAAPLLEKYGYRGIFFIDTVTIGKRYFMTADQLKDLVRRGHTLGSHTWDHRDIAILTIPEVQRQLDLSEQDLLPILGRKPTFISYPFGTYTPEDVTLLQSRGYQGGFRLRDRDAPVVDPAFMIHRQIVPGAWSLDDFADNVHWMED